MLSKVSSNFYDCIALFIVFKNRIFCALPIMVRSVIFFVHEMAFVIAI
jgi:hypothetical protein